jgi:hypothetical protein
MALYMQDKNKALDGPGDGNPGGSIKQRDANGRLLPGHTLWKKHLHKTKRKGSRNKFNKAFVDALLIDFEVHGQEAVEACRTFEPGTYLKIIASLSPKQVPTRPEAQMSDDELEYALTRLIFPLVPATL